MELDPPPGQFPSHFLTSPLLKLYRKWHWGLLGSFLYISLFNFYLDSIEMALGPPIGIPGNLEAGEAHCPASQPLGAMEHLGIYRNTWIYRDTW